MSATDELRRMLDERGVKWRLVNDECILWTGADGAAYTARDGFTFAGPDGTVTVYNMTPEQAVAATLGPGTCRDVSRTHGRWTCSECGRSMAVALTDEPPKFCPNCGRRVVSGHGEE